MDYSALTNSDIQKIIINMDKEKTKGEEAPEELNTIRYAPHING